MTSAENSLFSLFGIVTMTLLAALLFFCQGGSLNMVLFQGGSLGENPHHVMPGESFTNTAFACCGGSTELPSHSDISAALPADTIFKIFFSTAFAWVIFQILYVSFYRGVSYAHHLKRFLGSSRPFIPIVHLLS